MSADPKRRQLITGLCIVGLIAIGVGVVAWRFGQEREKATRAVRAGSPADHGIVVEATIVSVDPPKNEMTVRVLPLPFGSFGQLSYERAFTLVTGTSNGLEEQKMEVGQPVTAFDVTTSLSDGQVTNYPLDSYSADLGFLLFEPQPGDDGTAGARPVPLQVKVTGVLHGYKIEAASEVATNPVAGGEATVSNTEFRVARSASTRFFALFVIVLMWAISIGILWIALTVFYRRRKIELAVLSVMGIVLFALPNIRNVQPNAPPIGSLTDVLSFFWCESLVAACLVAMIMVFVRRSGPDDAEPVRAAVAAAPAERSSRDEPEPADDD